MNLNLYLFRPIGVRGCHPLLIRAENGAEATARYLVSMGRDATHHIEGIDYLAERITTTERIACLMSESVVRI